jgi:caffeoyl-CoA O-methyltransferase
MSIDSDLFQPGIRDYVFAHSVREPEILARLRAETAAHPAGFMQIPPEQGQLFQLFVRMLGARRTLEIGVFTGYSSLSVAMALPPEGRIVACDISDEYTSIARRYWAEAGLAHKIDLRIGPAAATLRQLIAQGESGKFDLAFIDADKTGYRGYYEQCLQLVRPNGLIVLDNMFQSGDVMRESTEENVIAIQQLNDFIHHDERVDALLLPFSDGLTLAVRR